MGIAAASAFRPASAPVLALSVLAGCSPVTAPRDTAARTGPDILYVIERGWHTDIGLSADAIEGPLATLRQTFPGVRYLVFGFGERRYMLSRDKDPGEMLLALLPGPGVMLVTALRAPPGAAFGPAHVVMLHLRRDGVDRVSGFLWSYLAKDRNGAPRLIADGPYPGSRFYASGGTYALSHTCNTWTAEALQAGGLPVSGSGVLFAGQVFQRARETAASQAAADRTSATGGSLTGAPLGAY